MVGIQNYRALARMSVKSLWYSFLVWAFRKFSTKIDICSNGLVIVNLDRHMADGRWHHFAINFWAIKEGDRSPHRFETYVDGKIRKRKVIREVR